MAIIPGFNYTQVVSIVANSVTAINDELTAKAADGWALITLIDKPATDEVYLAFAKSEAVSEI